MKPLRLAAALGALSGLTIATGAALVHLAAGLIVAGVLGAVWTALFVLEVGR